jgi:hypothetical protein
VLVLLDATPSHSWLRDLYKYPHAAYPYARRVDETRRRSRQDPPFTLLDSGVFDAGRYFDVEMHYAKAAPEEIHIRIIATNRGPDPAPIHLLPTLWLRNTWSWGDAADKPVLREDPGAQGANWAVQAGHPSWASTTCMDAHRQPLYTENEQCTTPVGAAQRLALREGRTTPRDRQRESAVNPRHRNQVRRLAPELSVDPAIPRPSA